MFRFFFPVAVLLTIPAIGLTATFNVNTHFDLPSANPGNGSCAAIGFPPTPPHSIPPGLCSLRAAIQEANAVPGGDTIIVPGGLVYALGIPYTGLGTLVIDSSMTVTQFFLETAPRPIINGNGRPGVFDILSGNVTLGLLDITGGSATIPESSSGGGISVAFAAGTVNLTLLRIFNNSAGSGGGLYNDGPDTTLYYSEVFQNHRVDGFGGANSGAGIFNRGTLRIENSAIFANTGSVGIDTRPHFSGEPTMVVINSTIANHESIGLMQRSEGTLTVRSSTIANNLVGLRLAGIDGTGGSLFLRVTAIVDNLDADCNLSPAATLNLNRYNLDSDNSCELSSGSTNFWNQQARLTPLERHTGEFTHSMRPLPDSPLIDQGHPAIGPIGCPDEDQRFEPRPVDYDNSGTPRCDIGAVELQEGEDTSGLFQDRFES